MSPSAVSERTRTNETELGTAVLRVAASRTLQELGEAYHAGIHRLIGSRSIGIYALAERQPRLLLSRETSAGFLQDYAKRSEGGDLLVELMCDRRGAIDGATELGDAAWLSSGSFDLLRRWGYAHCMGGPLFVESRPIGVVYTARSEQVPYPPQLIRRFDMLCQAGSVALSNMLAQGVIGLLAAGLEFKRPISARFPESRRGIVGEHLPRRSREVASLLLQGRTNKEIARALSLSTHTVKEYVGNLCRRFGAQNRTELAHRLSGPS